MFLSLLLSFAANSDVDSLDRFIEDNSILIKKIVRGFSKTCFLTFIYFVSRHEAILTVDV